MPKTERVKKRQVALYVILRLLVVAIMLMEFFNKNYSHVFTCALTLILFMIPAIVDKQFHIKLPTALEYVILLFIFAADILGEIQGFYLMFPHWDTMLHTINGFLMAAIGFSMIDILNQNPRFHIQMSPAFVAFVSICFSMTIGVLWEFFEFFMDIFTATDMQKDTIYPMISSVALNSAGENAPVVISQVQETKILGMVNGKMQAFVIPGGYLDIGLWDTMADLLVNLIGAIVFSVIGGFYIKGRGGLAKNFIPQMKTKAEIARTEAEKKKKQSDDNGGIEQ